MYLQQVVTKKDISLFLDFPDTIHQNNPNYIRPPDREIEDIFDVQTNPLFLKGQCKRWILLNENEAPIGRIAVFINPGYRQAQPTGGIGFFDCIDETEPAHFLFRHAQKWLSEKGISAMDGPINFGERMKFWGLLTEGFQPPLYAMNYHPPYYKILFESYGFQPYYEQNCYNISITQPLPEKYNRIAHVFSSNPSYHVQTIDKNHLAKFAKDFAAIYNSAWQTHGEGKTMHENEALGIFYHMRTVMDEKIIWFAYYNTAPIAFWINLPDLNEYIKKLNPKLTMYAKIKWWWLKKFRPAKKFVGLIFGVIPQFQGKGVEAYLISTALQYIRSKTKYEAFEVQWIGDFNVKMERIIKSLKGQRTRTLTTYRYHFNKDQNTIYHPKI